jgi:hypothetical protein
LIAKHFAEIQQNKRNTIKRGAEFIRNQEKCQVVFLAFLKVFCNSAEFSLKEKHLWAILGGRVFPSGDGRNT